MRKGMFLLVLLLLGLPQILMAAETDRTLEYRLDQITVLGEQENDLIRNASVNDVVISEEEIQAANADTLADLLEQKGFAVIQSANGYDHTFFVIRGYRSDHLGKELDGRVLMMVDGRRSGASDAATMSLLNVERVEILRGPEMLQYSAAFSGGIVNIVTKRPKGEVPMSGMIEAGMGTDGYYKGQVAVNGATSGFDYSLGYRYTTTDDYHAPNGDKVKYSSTDGMQSTSANIGYTFMDTHRIGVNAYYYRVDNASKPATTDQWGDYEEANYANRENWFMDLNYDGQTRDGSWSWSANYSFGSNFYRRFSADVSDPLNKKPFGHYYDTQTAEGRITYNGGMFDISTGFQWWQYDCDLYNSTYSNKRFNSFTTDNYGTFLMGRLFLLDSKLVLSAAARYDYYNIHDDGKNNVFYVNGNVIPGRYQDTKTNQTYDAISPSIGAAYMPLNWLKLRGNYTRGFRVPSGRELVEDHQYNYWGNPDNDAEYADTYEGGFDFLFGWFDFSTTFFYIHTKDYIYQHSDPYMNIGASSPPFTQTQIDRHMRVQNADKQVRSGFEIQTSADIAQFFGWADFVVRPSFNLNYMFTMKEKYRSYSSWDRIPQNVPKYTFGTGLYFRHIPSELKANISLTHMGKYKSGSTNVGSYTLVNASLEKRLFSFDEYGELSLRAEVKNLLDERYYGNSGTTYYMPGRSFYLGVIYRF